MALLAKVILTVGMPMFPFVMPSSPDPNSSLTAWDAMASHKSLGIGLALAFGIINVMWLEANYAFGERDENLTRGRFERARQTR